MVLAGIDQPPHCNTSEGFSRQEADKCKQSRASTRPSFSTGSAIDRLTICRILRPFSSSQLTYTYPAFPHIHNTILHSNFVTCICTMHINVTSCNILVTLTVIPKRPNCFFFRPFLPSSGSEDLRPVGFLGAKPPNPLGRLRRVMGSPQAIRMGNVFRKNSQSNYKYI
jgi:hypothetical protein